MHNIDGSNIENPVNGKCHRSLHRLLWSNIGLILVQKFHKELPCGEQRRKWTKLFVSLKSSLEMLEARSSSETRNKDPEFYEQETGKASTDLTH